MTIREWLENKGIDTETKELQALVEPLEAGVTSVEADDPDDGCIYFYFNLEDGENVHQEIYVDDNEIEDIAEDFNTDALLRFIEEAIWENAHDYLDNPEFFTDSMRNFIIKLSEWEQSYYFG